MGGGFQRRREILILQLHRAHVPDHVARIVQGRVRRREHILQGLGALLASLREQALDRAQLNGDAGECLEQGVMQLLGDAGTFGERRLIAQPQSAGDLPHSGQVHQPD